MASGFPRGDRYSWGALALHWAIAALVLANIAIGILNDSPPRERRQKRRIGPFTP